MAKFKVDTAYLHNTFLLNGKNFGPTIEVKKVSGLEMIYDDVEDRIEITYATSTKSVWGLIPESNISLVVPEQGPALQVVEPPAAPKGKVKAQASSPVGHVFEGPGHGQTGQEKK